MSLGAVSKMKTAQNNKTTEYIPFRSLTLLQRLKRTVIDGGQVLG